MRPTVPMLRLACVCFGFVTVTAILAATASAEAVPTVPTADASTVGLWLFQEGQGDRVASAIKDGPAGKVHGAERFAAPPVYDDDMPGLVRRIRTRKTQPAEVQTLFLGPVAITGIPAEYFVEHGLRIKEQTYPWKSLVVSCANGMVGYLPTAQAFTRGGYETTFAPSSRMAPAAGDLVADAAIAQINRQPRP